MLLPVLTPPPRSLRPETYDPVVAPRALPAIEITRVPCLEFDTSVNCAAHPSHNQKNSTPRGDFGVLLSPDRRLFGESKRKSLPVCRRRKVAEHPGLEHLESICLRVISGPMVRENAGRRTCEKVHRRFIARNLVGALQNHYRTRMLVNLKYQADADIPSEEPFVIAARRTNSAI